VLVNNAGIMEFEGPFDSASPAQDPENASLADWRTVNAVDNDGIIRGRRYAVSAMRTKGAGSLSNISSRSGLVGSPRDAAYAASKPAIRNHTKSVALHCAGQGLAIRCSAFRPAAIITPMWETMRGLCLERAGREAAMVADTAMR